MNGYLIIAGAMIICFADREIGSLTFKSGLRVGCRYPLIAIIMILVGMFV